MPVSSWGDIEFLIFFLSTFMVLVPLWGRHDYNTVYQTYQAKYGRGYFLRYPPLWFYKFMWAFVYACIIGGITIAWIYLRERTEWYIIVLSLFYTNVLSMQFWHVAYWRWDNWASLGTADTIFLSLSSGAIAGIVGYRADAENNMVLWGAFSAFAIYWAWSAYVSCLMLTTDWNVEDPNRGFVTKTKVPRGSYQPANDRRAKMTFTREKAPLTRRPRENEEWE